jgi:ABC-type bacteriocin/lantibiotic exporter with double-glycine peptidase domain
LNKFFKKILIILSKKEKNKIFLSLIFSLIKSILEVVSIGLLIPILGIASSQDNKYFLNNYFSIFQKLNSKEAIFFFILIFIFVYLIKTSFIIFYNRWNSRFVQNLSVDLMKKVLDTYLSKKYIFFLENNSALLIRNISSETSIFALGLIGSIISAVTNLIFIIFICTFLILYNNYYFYVIFFLALISFSIIRLSNDNFNKWASIRQNEATYFSKKLFEVLGSIKEVILYNKKSFFLEEISLHAKQFSNSAIYRDTASSFVAPIIEFIGILIFFIFFILLIFYSSMDLNEILVLFGVFAFACLRLLPTVIGFIRSFQNIKFNLPACDVVYQVLKDLKDSDVFLSDRGLIKNQLENIEFKNVSFSYRGQTLPVLKDLTFSIKKGDRIAVVGETGSGKTTLLNLISSLISPSTGKIIINNIDKIDFYKQIRNRIGYVSQSVYLSDNTVFFNVTLRNNVTEEERKNLLFILDSLNLTTINNEKINQFNFVGERGSKLSGGQIQRIGIARALFRDPDILILDESTNALDDENEEKILNYLIKKFSKKIIIFCSHKKEILKYCNKIIEVKNNTVNID